MTHSLGHPFYFFNSSATTSKSLNLSAGSVSISLISSSFIVSPHRLLLSLYQDHRAQFVEPCLFIVFYDEKPVILFDLQIARILQPSLDVLDHFLSGMHFFCSSSFFVVVFFSTLLYHVLSGPPAASVAISTAGVYRLGLITTYHITVLK